MFCKLLEFLYGNKE